MNANLRTVGLVARREFAVQVRTKSFLISNIVVLVLIVGGLVITSIVRGDGGPEKLTLALASPSASLSQTIEASGQTAGLAIDIQDKKGGDEVRAAVASEDADAGLVANDDGSYTAVAKEELDPALKAVLEGSVGQHAFTQALAEQDVDQARLDAAVAAAALQVQTTEPADPDKGQRVVLSLAVTYLLLFQIMGFCTYVAMGVVEEKSSRVVELLLSTIRPLQLLWGKVLGIGAVGLLQIVLYGAVGVATGVATGLLTISGTAVTVLAAGVGWFVLGYLLFAVLYAAAGSLVSRQEEVQSATMPLMMGIFAGFAAAMYTLGDPDSTGATVLGWIPPVSVFVMPIRTASGVAAPLEVAGSIALMIVACALVSLLSARIYRRSVLGTGARVSWLEAVKG